MPLAMMGGLLSFPFPLPSPPAVVTAERNRPTNRLNGWRVATKSQIISIKKLDWRHNTAAQEWWEFCLVGKMAVATVVIVDVGNIGRVW